MDRLRRILASGTLAITMSAAVGSTGCRSTGNEIPPQPKYTTPGENPSAVGFNSAPHGYNGVSSVYGNGGIPGQQGMPGGGGPVANGLGGGPPSDGLPIISANGEGSPYGTPVPNSGNPSLPTNNAYGSAGTTRLPSSAGAGAGAGGYGSGLGGGLGGGAGLSGSGLGGR